MKKGGLGNLREPKIKSFSVEDGTAELVNNNKSETKNTNSYKFDMISNVMDSVTGMVSEISNSIERVKVAKESTRQIVAQADRDIEVAKEKTEQVNLEQLGETKRFLAQKKVELTQIKVNYKQFLLDYKDKRNDLQFKKEVQMRELDAADQIIVALIDILKGLQREYNHCVDQGVEVPSGLRQEMTATMNKMAEISMTIFNK